MLFTCHIPKNTQFAVKYYSVSEPNVTIGRKGNSMVVYASDPFTVKRVTSELKSRGVDLPALGMRELYKVMLVSGLIQEDWRGAGKPHYNGNTRHSAKSHQKTSSYGYNYHRPKAQSVGLMAKTSENLRFESEELEMEKAPFKASSIKNLKVTISNNEPAVLVEYMRESQLIDIEHGYLPIADIVVENKVTGDTLFVERKRITDLYQSVINEAHSHDQSERMFEAVQEVKMQGKRAKAIWIIEAEPNKGLYHMENALPLIQNMDGLVNYFDMINDQSCHQSFGMKHTMYRVAKYAQGFFEQQLPYRVRTSNAKVNRSGKERIAAKQASQGVLNVSGIRDTGVRRHAKVDIEHMLAYLPGVNVNVATELAKTGKSFAEIVQMTVEELQAIKGIGAKSAKAIFDGFNVKS